MLLFFQKKKVFDFGFTFLKKFNIFSYFFQEFDFNELEKATEYEGGYTEKSKIITDFWDIVHSLSLESKKKLLEFTTGKFTLIFTKKNTNEFKWLNVCFVRRF